MKSYLWLIVVLVVLTQMVGAAEYKIDTTITVDWVGNNMFYIRTESGDRLFNASDQTDFSYALNFTRHTTTNQTEFEQVVSYMATVNKTCANLTGRLDASQSYQTGYFRELETNWTRCNLDKGALMLEVPALESQIKNMTSMNQEMLNICYQERDSAMVANSNCQILLGNATMVVQQEKQSNSQKTILVVICIIVAAILIYQEIQRRGKAHPDEMSLLSQQ